MEYQNLLVSCECGRVPNYISAVGLSTTHDLVIHWCCPQCRKQVYAVEALVDWWPGHTSADLMNTTLYSLDVRYQN
jgi:hypothetical protein